MSPAIIDQARRSANRVESLANRLATLGSLEGAEVCAGAAITIRLLAAALDTAPVEPTTPNAEAPSE